MSSNIQIQRVCQHCGNEFTAKTTVTKFCGDVCAKRAYKARQKAGKIEASNRETKRRKSQPIEDLKAKEFLTVSMAAQFMNCSRQNVYKLIKSGKIRATNILLKKTLIRRTELEQLMKEPPQPEAIPETQKQEIETWKASQLDIAECYTLTEIQSKYGISEKALSELIKRNSIPKLKKGWFAYVPKVIIDKLLN
ncbi:helix-turn-helix domain-containing protein [Adhaeribacter terreus]|uniref:Helix-turn-helix domain-containing protein n=1 Tax=Adhaeribacter terreus TaxID=529703 RepID=A0ABW0E800_9BACT